MVTIAKRVLAEGRTRICDLAFIVDRARLERRAQDSVGTIEKRPKVMTSPDGDDYIAIRQMAYFALTYDHRIVDGADAEKFLAYLKRYLEGAPFTI